MDDTEDIRRSLVTQINAQPGSREALAAQYGRVWDTNQMAEEYEVMGFAAPVVVVKRRSDGKVGSMFFQHSPRFYFQFVEDQ